MKHSIHLNVEKSNLANRFIKVALSAEILLIIKQYELTYNLVNINKYIWTHYNEWFMFIYMNDDKGNSIRIDLQLY